MTALVENSSGGRKFRHPGTRCVRSRAISWTRGLKLPTLNQTRFRIGSLGMGDLWMDTNP
jgi:hypothetical protein